MKYLILLLIAACSFGADTPLLRLNDAHVAQLGTPVYELIDPVTNRRWLVIKAETGTVMVEATPGPVVFVPAPPAPIVTPEPKYWEEAQSYSFVPAHAAKGWELKGTIDTPGGRIYHLRRKNPLYKGPPLEQLPLEK